MENRKIIISREIFLIDIKNPVKEKKLAGIHSVKHERKQNSGE